MITIDNSLQQQIQKQREKEVFQNNEMKNDEVIREREREREGVKYGG
jgi:hypothetical protein